METETDAYDRQRRLSEVGASGQARIEDSEAHISAGPSAAIELAYLVRSGVRRASIVGGATIESAHDAIFRFAGPHAVALGAERALCHLLRALDPP